MRHIARYFLHARHQTLDLVEHGVEGLGEAVELIAGALYRHAAAQIAHHDRAAGVGDGIDAAQEIPAHQKAAAEAQHERDDERRR